MANKKYLDQEGLRVLWQRIKDKLANLADDKSTIYMTEDEHLSIKGYESASHGQMLVKDTIQGLTWVNPVSDQSLQQAVQTATAQAAQAGQYATQAGNSAIAAHISEQVAQRINEQTMDWVNNKFWWGTISEYNTLESIDEGTFYFIQM